MIGFVLGRIVRMHGVGHVGRDEEGRSQGALVGIRRVGLSTARRARGLRFEGQKRETSNDGRQQIRVGALCGLAPDLFVVEQGQESDGAFIIQRRSGRQGIDEADGATEGHHQVVQSGAEDELVVDATDTGGLGVIEEHLEIEDIARVDSELASNDVDDDGMVSVRHGLQRVIA